MRHGTASSRWGGRLGRPWSRVVGHGALEIQGIGRARHRAGGWDALVRVGRRGLDRFTRATTPTLATWTTTISLCSGGLGRALALHAAKLQFAEPDSRWTFVYNKTLALYYLTPDALHPLRVAPRD